MNKMSTRFITLLIGSVVLISVTLTFVSLRYGSLLLLDATEKKLLDELGRFTEQVNTELFAKETFVVGLESIINGTFDMEKFNSDSTYFDRYEEDLIPIVKAYSQPYLNAYVFFNPLELKQTMDIWFYDRNHDGVVERIPEAEYEYYLDPTGKDWFFGPVNSRKEFWTDPYPGTIVKENIFVSHTRPVFAGDKVIAVVGTDFEYTRLQEELIQYEIYETGYAFVMNESYDFIIHPLKDQYVNLMDINDGSYQWMIEKMETQESGMIDYNWINNKDKRLVYTRLNNGWIIGIAVGIDEIYAPLRSHARNLIYASITLMVLASYAGYRFSKRITDPLDRIVKQVQRIGHGDYSSHISEDLILDVTEIGILSDGLEEMRGSLERSFELIKKQNEELDHKVVERTHELNQANSELQASIQDLRKTQSELVTSEKQKAISHIVIEIAHRLNTPIGNTLTLMTFMENLNRDISDELHSEKPSINRIRMIIDDSNDIISGAILDIKKASGIIASLKEFTFKNSFDEESEIEFPLFITKNVLMDKSLVINDALFSIDVICEKQIKISTNAYLMYKVLTSLLSFSSYSSVELKKKKSVEYQISEGPFNILIDYIDHGIPIGKELKEMIFEPFAFTSFHKGIHGVELFLVYSIVTEGLNGYIEYVENKENHLYLRITIPKKEESS